MKITSAGITTSGNVRPNNEDNFYIDGNYKKDNNDASYAIAVEKNRICHVYAVCDGMGGYTEGEVASLKAIEVLKNYDDDNLEDRLEKFVSDANNAICFDVKRNQRDKAGTTLAVAIIKEGAASFCNVGDSRIYYFSEDNLEQMSVDHTRAQSMINAGIITPEEALLRKESHILTQHLGINETEFIVSPCIKRNVALKDGDILLLCSDGLSGAINDNEIKNILMKTKNEQPERIATELTARALKNGGNDNITTVIVKVE